MNKVELNPANFKEKYIQYLNVCFPNWGGEKEYKWVFERKVGEHEADFMIIRNENDEIIAGSAVTYRKVKLKNEIVDIGIMTGSWTLPEARGRGCFTQIIQESSLLCNNKNVPFLTAFVTESNASYRRLKDAGSYCLPANNIFSPEQLFSLENTEFTVEDVKDFQQSYLYDLYLSKNVDCYSYTIDEFTKQYLYRTNEVKILKVNDIVVLYETNATTTRILFISQFDIEVFKFVCNYLFNLLGKKIMIFSSNKNEIELLNQNGFNIITSYFTILPTIDNIKEPEIFKDLNIFLADKM